MDDVLMRAKRVRGVAFDCDGVFFTGRVFVDQTNGEQLKERSLVDGQGISLLRDAGVRIAFVTAESTGFMNPIVEKLNNLKSVKDGSWAPLDLYTGAMGKGKVEIIEKWLQDQKLAWDECAYMGDDLSDYEVLQKVGLAVAPAQAENIIKRNVHFVARRHGGDGAIRDLANLILEAKGINPTQLRRH